MAKLTSSDKKKIKQTAEKFVEELRAKGKDAFKETTYTIGIDKELFTKNKRA